MTLKAQASWIVDSLINGEEDHLLCNENRELFEEYIEAELLKAFEAGQRAALEASGQQTRMEINSYLEAV